MKAVVLEIQDGVAAVLTEDGTVEKVRRECMVGETIELDTVLAAMPTAAPRVTATPDVNGMPSASAAQYPTAAKGANAHSTSARRTLRHHAL